MAKKGLGKGLDALFVSDFAENPAPVSSEPSGDGSLSVKITDIDPNKNQPRKLFFDDSLEELAESIRIHGILQPLALRRAEGGRYQIIAGERRFRAAKRAGAAEKSTGFHRSYRQLRPVCPAAKCQRRQFGL